MKKELIVVGDKVLILPDGKDDRTDTGLYLPQGVKEKDQVQSGTVVKIGPGYPVPDPSVLGSEPWQNTKAETKYLALQAREGDHCIFLKNEGIEVEFEKKKYIVVPQSAILLLLRSDTEEDTPRHRKLITKMGKLKLDLHDIFNKGNAIEVELNRVIEEAVEKKIPLVEIIPGKGSGQLKKRVLRFLDEPRIKALYHRVEKDDKNFGSF